MTLVLTIATADLRRLAGIDAADTSRDATLAAVVTAEQPAIEYGLDPTTLASAATDAGLMAVLTLGAEELCAATYLQQLSRSALPLASITLGTLVLKPPGPTDWLRLADDLQAKGTNRLAPYTRAGVAATELAAAKLSQAQAQAAKVGAVDPAGVSILQGDTSGGLFGTLAADALGTDDSAPPAEFSTGFVSSGLSDVDDLSDPPEGFT